MRPTLLLTAGLMLAGQAVPPPALAGLTRLPSSEVVAETVKWRIGESPEGVVVAYEAADPAAQSLLLNCDADSGRIYMRIRQLGARVPAGVGASVTFASEGGSVVVPMVAERLEGEDRTVLGGTATLTMNEIRMLRGITLRVSVGGEDSFVSLLGAELTAAALQRRCAPASG